MSSDKAQEPDYAKLTVRQILQGQVLGPTVPMLLNAWILADRLVWQQQIEMTE